MSQIKCSHKNANGSGTIRKRKDGTWEARITVGHDSGTGKQIQRSVYGKTQAEVRKKLSAVTHEIDEGTYSQPSKLTVADWCDIWLKDFIGAVKPSTVEQYNYMIRIHIKPNLGALKLTSLTAAQIQKVYNNALKPHKSKIIDHNGETRVIEQEPISAKSVRNLHGILHHLLDQAVRLEYIRSNPADAVQLPRVEKFEIQPITDEYVAPFLKALEHNKYHNVFLVDVLSGLRQGELLGLTWDCVDFHHGTLLVNKQLQHRRFSGEDNVWELLPTKTDKERVVTPAPMVMDTLARIRREQNEYRLKSGGAWQNEMNLVFVNEKGEHLHPNTLRQNLKHVCAEIGLDSTRFHDLRHTFASLSIQNGDSLKTVADQLGHSTITTTANIYAHVTDQMRKESADRMQRFIESVK